MVIINLHSCSCSTDNCFLSHSHRARNRTGEYLSPFRNSTCRQFRSRILSIALSPLQMLWSAIAGVHLPNAIFGVSSGWSFTTCTHGSLNRTCQVIFLSAWASTNISFMNYLWSFNVAWCYAGGAVSSITNYGEPLRTRVKREGCNVRVYPLHGSTQNDLL